MTPPGAPVPPLPAASVIVVSRHRAASLARCLTALALQDHPRFEVIVVADPQGLQAALATGLPLKTASFDEPNISAARNAGLALAAAPVVAFIDDDAVAEPTWLSRLCAPFGDGHVGAATGFVRGRNGISLQWGAAWVDADGGDHPFELPEAGGVFPPAGGRVIKTQGTNCAFRRDALLAAGGFDPAFRFYLDEVAVNLRLQAVTAVVPLAQVQHGYEASARRRADRIPTSLEDIGASTLCLLRRQGADVAVTAGVVARLLAAQKARVDGLLARRRITPDAAARLMQSLRDGLDAGGVRPLPPLPPLAAATAPLAALPGTGPRPGLVLAGRWFSRARLQRQAAAAAGQAIVTVICLTPGFRRHRATFDPRGFWLQEGGLFGRSGREGPFPRPAPFRRRILTEMQRLAKYRPTVA